MNDRQNGVDLRPEDLAMPLVLEQAAPGPEAQGDEGAAAVNARRASQATKALQLALAHGSEPWTDSAGTPHISFPVDVHLEHCRLRPDPESGAGRWLSRVFFQNEGRALSSSAKKDALENLIAQAVAADRVFATGRRVVRIEDKVYLDLCSPSWEVVEVGPAGWRIRPAAEVPVRFTRSANMLPLPSPVPGGHLESLRPFFNCGEEDFRLVIAWALAALSGGREYPLLVLGGEPGSAKSTATRYARALVDPNAAPLRKCPREERDLFVAASNAFVLTFDNLSQPPEWLSDALCALALDTGYACRALYTDDGEAVFRVASPIILNGISEQLNRSDLADRALSVTLHRIPPERMRPKDEMDRAFEAAVPGILGALLDVLASALAKLPSIQLDRYPRMAQTAKLMAAAETDLGWAPGTFARIFDRAQAEVAVNIAEGDPIAQALLELVRRGGGRWSFKGSATDLRALLTPIRPSPMPPVWPPAPNKLSERLRRIAPQLRLMGWEVNPDGRDGTKKNGRRIQLDYSVAASSPSSDKEKEESFRPSDCPIPARGADSKAAAPADLTASQSSSRDPWTMDPGSRTIPGERLSEASLCNTNNCAYSDDSEDQAEYIEEGLL